MFVRGRRIKARRKQNRNKLVSVTPDLEQPSYKSAIRIVKKVHWIFVVLPKSQRTRPFSSAAGCSGAPFLPQRLTLLGQDSRNQFVLFAPPRRH